MHALDKDGGDIVVGLELFAPHREARRRLGRGQRAQVVVAADARRDERRQGGKSNDQASKIRVG